MRTVIVTDTHYGYGSDSETHLSHFRRFFREVFWPEVDRRGVDSLVHAGDVVDRRKFINYRTAAALREDLIEPAASRGIPIIATPGNHDCHHKNTNRINAWTELTGSCGHVTHETGTFHWRGMLMVPWICDENRAETMETIASSPARVVIGHLELNGSKMYRSSPVMNHGMDPAPLHRFDAVLSGHFHTRSTTGNVVYLGSPYEMTWADYADPKGFHFLTDAGLEFVENPNRLHVRLTYSDGHEPVIEPERIRGGIVRLVVGERSDGLAFDSFVSRIEACSPARIQVIDEAPLVAELGEVADAEGIEDTGEFIRRSIASMDDDELGVDRTLVLETMMEIYRGASS